MIKLGSKESELEKQIQNLSKVNTFFNGMKGTKYIGHRGLSVVAPENTIPSYELAGKVGMWGAECDISTTSDGEWVLMHDSTVDRMTDGAGNVSSFTLAEIKALTINSGNNIEKYPNLKIPTLSEYLIICKKYKIIPVIEIKSETYTSNDYDNFIGILEKHNIYSECVVISFNFNILQEIRSRNGKIYIQFLADINEINVNAVLELGNSGLDVPYSNASLANIEYAHSRGVAVNCWTVDSHQIAKTLVSYGVDFITTNNIIEVV